MRNDGRVITANLPVDLASRLDEVAGRIDRARSWIVREAVSQWLTEEQRRYQLTLQALEDVDQGCVISHEDLKQLVKQTRTLRSRAKNRCRDCGLSEENNP